MIMMMNDNDEQPHVYEAERINTPGHREVNELDYEFLEAERKVLKVEAERRTNGRTNGCARTD